MVFKVCTTYVLTKILFSTRERRTKHNAFFNMYNSDDGSVVGMYVQIFLNLPWSNIQHNAKQNRKNIYI